MASTSFAMFGGESQKNSDAQKLRTAILKDDSKAVKSIVDTRNAEGREILLTTAVGKEQWTALHYAAHLGRKEIVDVLLASGPKTLLNATDSQGNTPSQVVFTEESVMHLTPENQQKYDKDMARAEKLTTKLKDIEITLQQKNEELLKASKKGSVIQKSVNYLGKLTGRANKQSAVESIVIDISKLQKEKEDYTREIGLIETTYGNMLENEQANRKEIYNSLTKDTQNKYFKGVFACAQTPSGFKHDGAEKVLHTTFGYVAAH